MMMVRLNTRHELPQIGIHQTFGRFDETAIIQPYPEGTNQQARSNQTVSQPSLDLDSYPSRKAYGYRKPGDLMAEQGQRGKSDVQAATRRHAAEGWSKATTAAQPGNDIVQKIKSEIFSDYQARAVFTTAGIPDAEMQGHPSEIVGKPEPSNISVDIKTAPSARIHYTRGGVETYLENEGFIHTWVSYSYYDIYA
jgi:hypothetical protein